MPRSHKAFSLGPLGGHKVHKMVKFRPRGMVDKREMEQAQLFETADERGCTPMFGAAHRRASAVPHPPRAGVASRPSRGTSFRRAEKNVAPAAPRQFSRFISIGLLPAGR